MKLLLLFSASCAALSLPKADRDEGLVIRAPQEQKYGNPDNEPDYEEGTGNKIAKSRVLEGLADNPEANARWFDWDESCKDEDQRRKILTAFRGVMSLADWTSKYLEETKGKLPEPIQDRKDKRINRKWFSDHDPAYYQMFKGWDGRINYVRETFDLIGQRAQTFQGRAADGQKNPLRFICNADNHVMRFDGTTPLCGNVDQAITLHPWNPDSGETPLIEAKYAFVEANSITFCPAFFDDNKFPVLDVVKNDGREVYLNNVDSAERILLHEYIHVPWIRDAQGPQDEIGYLNAAKLSRMYGWNTVKENPDNFAWLALYAYFNQNNNLEKCDVWPGDGSDKPNPPMT